MDSWFHEQLGLPRHRAADDRREPVSAAAQRARQHHAHQVQLALRGKDIRKVDDWFDRHGPKAVLFGRMIPGIRSLLSLPAGMSEMPLPSFLIYSTIGSGLWATLLAGAGYLLGNNYEVVEQLRRLNQNRRGGAVGGLVSGLDRLEATAAAGGMNWTGSRRSTGEVEGIPAGTLSLQALKPGILNLSGPSVTRTYAVRSNPVSPARFRISCPR